MYLSIYIYIYTYTYIYIYIYIYITGPERGNEKGVTMFTVFTFLATIC